MYILLNDFTALRGEKRIFLVKLITAIKDNFSFRLVILILLIKKFWKILIFSLKNKFIRVSLRGKVFN